MAAEDETMEFDESSALEPAAAVVVPAVAGDEFAEDASALLPVGGVISSGSGFENDIDMDEEFRGRGRGFRFVIYWFFVFGFAYL